MAARDCLGVDVDAIARALGGAGIAAAHRPLTPLGGGADNRLFAAETAAGERLIVKIRRRHRRARYDVAAWAARRLAAAAVPTPRILWHSHDICVETHCPGRPLVDAVRSPAAADLRAARAAGDLLRRLHSVSVRGFGRLDAAGIGQHSSLRAWLLSAPSDPPPAARNVALVALTERVTRTLRTSGDLVSAAPPRLLHGDWSARHVLADAGRVTGIVDLESVRGGDPLCDLAGWSLQEPPRLTRALLEGYFPEPPDGPARAALALYRIRIAASLLRHHAANGDNARARARARQIEHDLEDLEAGRPTLVPRTVCSLSPIRPRDTQEQPP